VSRFKPEILINVIVKKYDINYILFFKIIILIKYYGLEIRQLKICYLAEKIFDALLIDHFF
jgi:hypothetical protein